MHLPFRDGVFDVIFCNHVLEHVQDDNQALQQLLRVLKKGGWALLLAPIDESRAETFEDKTVTSPEARQKLFGQTDHLRLYGRDYASRLEQQGFEVQEVEASEFCQENDYKSYGLDPEEKIYIGISPVGAV